MDGCSNRPALVKSARLAPARWFEADNRAVGFFSVGSSPGQVPCDAAWQSAHAIAGRLMYFGEVDDDKDRCAPHTNRRHLELHAAQSPDEMAGLLDDVTLLLA